MKETIQANIGSVAFTIDKDAYEALHDYLEAIRRHLPEGDSETLADIEARLAEILREKVPSPMRVISVEHVQAAMAQIGAPSEFGQTTREEVPQDQTQPQSPRKLYRSTTNRSIAGICGGLSELFGVDATAVRLITFFLIFFGGLSLWVYLLLWLVIPQEPQSFNLAK